VRRRFTIRRALAVAATAVLFPIAAAVTEGLPTASAAFWPAGVDFWVDSGMGPIKSRVFRAHDGNTRRVVYALDGLRARNDLNGWEIETNIAQLLTSWNINVVMPVGGQSSFYSDWVAPSSFGPLGSSSGSAAGLSSATGSSSGSADQRVRNTWETFLTRDLPAALHARLGFASTRNGVFGLSMGGSAALTLAAYHPNQFSYAGSFSGFLNNSAPGMPTAMRLALLDSGGYNIDDMWGPPYSPGWYRNDPFAFAPLLQRENIRLFIAGGSGVPTGKDFPRSPVDVLNAMGVEAVASEQTRAFEIRLDTLGYHNVVYDFAPFGTHSWVYWADDVATMLPDLSTHIG
jgi:diacylglycerol O-acyltransferase/trehalose O-mycolyltransferase